MSSPRLYPDIYSAHNARQLTSSQNDAPIFHPFKRLALELRLQIWSEALPPPRVLEVELRNGWVPVLSSSHQPSALLGVNRESRNLYLESYRKFDLLIPASNENRQTTPAKAVWHFNPMIDTIYISRISQNPSQANYSLDQLATEPSFRELEFLAVNHSYIREILTLRNLARFPAMKELRVITADHLWDERGGDGKWKKVEGKIEIIGKVFQWDEDRESLIKDGIKWYEDRLLHAVDALGSSMASIPVIREMNILRGGIGMLGIGDW